MNIYRSYQLKHIEIECEELRGEVYDYNNELCIVIKASSIKDFMFKFTDYVDKSINNSTTKFITDLQDLCKQHNVRLSSDTYLKINGNEITEVVDGMINRIKCFSPKGAY